MNDRVEMYFSFRSPYSWLGFLRLNRAIPDLGVEVDFTPVFPNPKGPEPQVTADPRRRHYLIEDVERITAAYGLEVKWPGKVDTDWARPHLAAICAEDLGRGREFIEAGFRARFQQGLDLGADETLAGVSTEAGLDPEALMAACEAPEYRDRLQVGFARAEQNRLFGVPFCTFRGRKFWGNDRLEWLIREIDHGRGCRVPDLTKDPFVSPCRSPLGDSSPTPKGALR
jgi:2-hydroxychromene-2-carboxylate isomerase